jgi:hypothetical protein
MQRSLAEQLMQASSADFESPEELNRAHEFALETLRTVKNALPPAVVEVIDSLGMHPPAWRDSEKERVALWDSIAGDSMGTTPAGAATRAALFVFLSDDAFQDHADDVIWHFEMFYSRAGLPADAFTSTFRRYWPA